MLDPQFRWISGTLHHHMRVLAIRAFNFACWPIVEFHAMRRLRPCLATVFRHPNPATGNGNANRVGIAWVNTDRMNAWNISAAAQPLITVRMPP